MGSSAGPFEPLCPPFAGLPSILIARAAGCESGVKIANLNWNGASICSRGVAPVSNGRPIAIVTGATRGIGRWIALGMARAGHHVVMIGRDRARGVATQTWIDHQVPRASTATSDSRSLAAIRNAECRQAYRRPLLAHFSVDQQRRGLRIHTELSTEEGHDRVLATNLLCPFVLTQVLLPLLVAGAPSRIINIGSSTSDRAQIDPDALVLGRRWAMRRAYSQSKLALMMTTFRLANRLRRNGRRRERRTSWACSHWTGANRRTDRSRLARFGADSADGRTGSRHATACRVGARTRFGQWHLSQKSSGRAAKPPSFGSGTFGARLAGDRALDVAPRHPLPQQVSGRAQPPF